MDAKLAAELAAAEAELAAARAELAAIEAGKIPAAPRRAARPKRAAKKPARPVHRPENGMQSSIEGYGGPAPTGERTRSDDAPVIMKHVSPFDRPVGDAKMPRKVSVTIYDDAKVVQVMGITMMEREVDEYESNLPWGWTLTYRVCK